MINVILQVLQLDLVNINVSAKFYQNIPNGLRIKFHSFQNLNLGKTSTNPKCHLLSHGLHHVCINMYAKFHQNIPLSSRDRAVFNFSEFGALAKPRPMKNAIFQSLELDLVNINFTQNFIKIFHSVQEIGLFSLFQNLNLGNASANPK